MKPTGITLRDSTGELSATDNHPADVGTEVFERERDLAIQGTLEHELEQIHSALREWTRANTEPVPCAAWKFRMSGWKLCHIRHIVSNMHRGKISTTTGR